VGGDGRRLAGPPAITDGAGVGPDRLAGHGVVTSYARSFRAADVPAAFTGPLLKLAEIWYLFTRFGGGELLRFDASGRRRGRGRLPERQCSETPVVGASGPRTPSADSDTVRHPTSAEVTLAGSRFHRSPLAARCAADRSRDARASLRVGPSGPAWLAGETLADRAYLNTVPRAETKVYVRGRDETGP
jgi:hypothetical protein